MKMKKIILFTSIILILSLTISAASAFDSNNLTDENDDLLKVDNEIIDVEELKDCETQYSSLKEQDLSESEEILSSDNFENGIILEDNGTVVNPSNDNNDTQVNPSNGSENNGTVVNPSNDNNCSGDTTTDDEINSRTYEFLMKLVSSEYFTNTLNFLDENFNSTFFDLIELYNEASKYVNVSDLIQGFDELDKELNITGFITDLENLTQSWNTSGFISDFNSLTEDYNITELMDTLENLTANNNITQFIDSLKNATADLNILEFFNGLENLTNTWNISEFISGFENLTNKWNVSAFMNSFDSTNVLNMSAVINSLENIIKNVNHTDISKNVNDYIADKISGISGWINGIISSKETTYIITSQVSTTYGTGKNLQVVLLDESGNPLGGMNVTVTSNGKSVKRTTDGNGRISIAIANNLVPDTYIYLLKFEGNSKYAEAHTSVKAIVSKATPKLTAKKKTFKKSTKTKKYSIVLKTNKNKAMKKMKVILKIKGKTYKATTNSKGKATFKITKLTKKGTFNASITFKGNKYFKAKTVKAKIKVK